MGRSRCSIKGGEGVGFESVVANMNYTHQPLGQPP